MYKLLITKLLLYICKNNEVYNICKDCSLFYNICKEYEKDDIVNELYRELKLNIIEIE